MIKRSSILIIVLSLILVVSGLLLAFHKEDAKAAIKSVRNKAGMQLMVAEENTQPTLRIVLPGHPTSDRAIEIIFPEHLTVRPHGNTDATQLYMFQPGKFGDAPKWKRSERSLEYKKNIPGKVHMLARATLEEDGVRFHFELRNQSNITYDLVLAVLDHGCVFHQCPSESRTGSVATPTRSAGKYARLSTACAPNSAAENATSPTNVPR